MLSWLIFGTSIQTILNFVLVIAVIVGVIFLLIKVPGSRMIISGIMVLFIAGSGVYSGIKLNEYYTAEGGVFGKLEDILKPNKVEITDNVTSIDFDFSQVILTGSDDTMYTAQFTTEDIIKLNSNEYYKVCVNDEPCKVIDYTSSYLVCTYNYSFYDVGGVYLLTDELTFTFGFNKYSTDLVVSSNGSSQAVDLWNSYFDKNQFKVNISTTKDTYVSESKTAKLNVYLDDEKINTIEVPCGTVYTFEALPDLEDKVFMGYSLDETTLIDDNTLTVNFSLKVYAIYEDIHYIEFYNIKTSEPNFESQVFTSVGYINGALLSSKEIETPTRANYDFLGWSADGETVLDLSEISYDGTITKLYAVWEANSVIVNVELNGGVLDFSGVTYSSNFSFMQNFAEAISFSNVSKSGYTFYDYHVIFNPFDISTSVTSAEFSKSLNTLYYIEALPEFSPGNSSDVGTNEGETGYEYKLKDASSVTIKLFWINNLFTDEDVTSDDFSVSELSDYDLQYYVLLNMEFSEWHKDYLNIHSLPKANINVFDSALADCFSWMIETAQEMDWETKVGWINQLYSSASLDFELTTDMTPREAVEKAFMFYWNENHFVVTFMVENESGEYEVYETQTLSAGETVTLPNSVSREHYSFVGWSLDKINIAEDIEANSVNSNLVYYSMFNFEPYFEAVEFTGAPTSFLGYCVWTDGENIYYSSNFDQYVLDKSTSTWSEKTWKGSLNYFFCSYLWTDGENIYYSNSSNQYVLDKSTSKWSTKTWTGYTYLDGRYIWTDGENIYYSNSSNQYVLDKSTSTWSEKTWTGYTYLDGRYIWTDGENIYYSNDTNQYVLDKSTSTWSRKTWTGLTDFWGEKTWTDGENIYYSNSSKQYVLDKATSTWSTKTWTGLTDFTGNSIWTDGTEYYCYSSGSYYKLVLAA